MISMNFSNKVVIVTGAGAGIGKGVAQVFARAGARVIVNDINRKTGAQVAGEINAEGGEAIFVHGNVAKASDGIRMVETARKKFGALHTLVNNAGIFVLKGLVDTTPEEWDRTMSVDLRSIYCCSRPAIPLIEKSGGGAIINIASVHYRSTLAGFAAYAAAKGGVVGATRSIALELAPRQIRVNAICPGFTETEIYKQWLNTFPNPKKKDAECRKLQPTGKLSQPEDIGYATLFLASDLGRMITGTTLIVDGGLTARLYQD